MRTHIKTQHKPVYDEFLNGSCDKAAFNVEKYRYCSKCRQIYGWLEYIILTLSPFSYIENKIVRKRFSNDPISLTAFHSYMYYLTEHLEENICNELPDKFSLVIEGCTTADTHYIGLFVCFLKKEEPG